MRNPIRYQRRRGGIAVGCLIAAAVVLVILIAGGVFVALNARGWLATGLEAGIIQQIETSDLSNAEKAEVKAEVEALTAAFRAGDVTFEEIGLIVEQLTSGPLMPAAIVYGVSDQYIVPSALEEEEKAKAKVTMGRITRGMMNDQMSMGELREVVDPMVAPADSSSNFRINVGGETITLKPPSEVTDDELRAMLANAEAKADEKGFEVTDEEIDVSTEIRRAITEALGRELPPAPVDAPADADTDG